MIGSLVNTLTTYYCSESVASVTKVLCLIFYSQFCSLSCHKNVYMYYRLVAGCARRNINMNNTMIIILFMICYTGLVHGGKFLVKLFKSHIFNDSSFVLEFTVSPESDTVAVGENATFSCQYPSADNIRWKKDNQYVTNNPSQDISPGYLHSPNGIIYTLKIVARPEYNGSTIECVATFDDGTPQEQAPPVTLTGT